MKSKIIALVTASAIATAGLAPTTAQADPARDALGLFIGLAALAALADASNNNTRVVVTHGNYPRYQSNNNYRNNYRHNHRHNNQARNIQLPQQCKVTTHTRRGWIVSYKNRCMARLGWVQTRNGWIRTNHAHR